MPNQHDSASEPSFFQRFKNGFFYFYNQLSLNFSSWWKSLFNKKKTEDIVDLEPVIEAPRSNIIDTPRMRLVLGAATVGVFPVMQRFTRQLEQLPKSSPVHLGLDALSFGTYYLARHLLNNTSFFNAPKAQITAPVIAAQDEPVVTAENASPKSPSLSQRGIFCRNMLYASAAFFTVATVVGKSRH